MIKQLKTLLCGLTTLFWGISLTAQQDWQLLPLNQVTFWENQLGEVDMIYSDTTVIDSQGRTIQLVGGEYFKSGLGACVDTLYNHFRYLTTWAFYPNDYTPLRRIVLPLPDSLITTSDKYIWYNGKDSFWIKKNIALGDKWTIQCHSTYCDSVSFECVGRTQELALDFLDSVITIQPQAWLNGVMTNRFDSMDIKLSKTAGLFKMITPTGLYKDTTPRNWTIYGFKRPQDYIRYGYTNCPADYIWPCAVGDKLKYENRGTVSSETKMDSVIQITYTADSVIARVDTRSIYRNAFGPPSYNYEHNRRLSFPLNYNTSRWARKPSYSLTGSYVNIYYKTPEGFLHQTITFACSQVNSQIGCEIDSFACNWFSSYATSRRDIGVFANSPNPASASSSHTVLGYERCGVVYGDRRLLLSNDNVNLREWTYKAYPSPTSGFVHINLPQTFDGSVHIYNTLGQLMLSRNISASSNEVDLSSLETGLYHAVFYENGSIVGNTNVIKN